jgi:hypothetical protein
MATNPFGPQTGLLGLLGAGGNPIYRSLKDGGLLDSLAYGLASGTGLSDGLQKAALAQIGGRNDREERALKAAEWDKTQQQQNATRALLAKEAPDLAQLLDTGVPMGEVWGEYFRRKSPQSQDLPNEYELFQLSQKDPAFAEYLNSQKSTGSLPTSYQEWQLAQANPEYAKTLASSSTKPPTEGERRNNQLAMVIGPELDTVEKNWTALTDAGNQLKGAEVFGGRPGLATTSPEYQQAINSLSTIVASYLYSVSGATATDAEIKRQVELLTPKFGESEQSAKAKLDRIKTYAKAVTEAAGRAGAAPIPETGGYTVLGVE